MTYAGAYMKRQIDGEFDYTDYSYFYDALAGYGAYWYDNDDNLIDPNQYIVSDDSFKKQSHELRFTSPADKRLRVVGRPVLPAPDAQYRAELHHRQS